MLMMETGGAAALPDTEQVDPRSERLHAMSSRAIVDFVDEADRGVAPALAAAGDAIASLGDRMASALERGARVIYLGAGTSGRLGCLDAAEWPPTFGVGADRVVGVIAGGVGALARSVEGAEDSATAAVEDLRGVGLAPADLLVGISASGGAPYVLAGLQYARQLGTARALVTSLESAADPSDEQLLRVVVRTGREVLAGSTRLKAAAATHQVLQRASLVCAVRCGWVYRGRMVEMRPTNRKLRARAARIVADLARVTTATAAALLEAADWDIKVAIVCAVRRVDAGSARNLLRERGRRLDSFVSEL
jgi:N-acetylmuramic acid 6-phosphate etherase